MELLSFAYQFDTLNIDPGVPILCTVCTINYDHYIYTFQTNTHSSPERAALLPAKEKALSFFENMHFAREHLQLHAGCTENLTSQHYATCWFYL